MTRSLKIANQEKPNILSSCFLFIPTVTLMFLIACGGSSDNPSITIVPPEETNDVEIFTIDIKTAIYSGNIYNNGAVDNTQSSGGELFIKGMGVYDEPTPLGNVNEQGFELRLIQGEYQIEYSHEFGNELPLNKSYIVREEFSLTENLTQDIDIESVSVGFSAQLNGASFPSDPATEAFFYLKPVKGGEEIFLGTSFVSGQSISVIPGDYLAVYKYIRGENIPINVDFRLPKIYNITTDTTIEIAVPAVDVRVIFPSGDVKSNFDEDNVAHFLLKSSGSENMTDLGSTEQAFASVSLIVGDYNLIYDYQFGDEIPINKNKQISEIAIEDGTVIEPVIDKVTLQGRFYHNGEVPSGSGLDYALLFLQEQGTDELYLVGRTNDLSYENLNILAGSYNIIYEYREGNTLPSNSFTPMSLSVSLIESSEFDIDIKSVLVDFSVTLNSKAFPDSGLSYADLFLDGGGDTQVYLGKTNSTLEQVRILSKSYKLYYKAREFNNIPYHLDFVADLTFDIMESGSYQHNFEAKNIGVETLINGTAGLSSGLEKGNLYLKRYGETINIGDTISITERLIMAGEYAVYYEFRESQEIMPMNQYSRIGKINIQH